MTKVSLPSMTSSSSMMLSRLKHIESPLVALNGITIVIDSPLKSSATAIMERDYIIMKVEGRFQCKTKKKPKKLLCAPFAYKQGNRVQRIASWSSTS